MTLASRVACDTEGSVHVDGSYARFFFGNCRVLARLIDDNSPNYEALIPVDTDKRLVISREDMLAAVRRFGLYSSTMTNQIRLSIKEDKVEISAEDIERSSEAHETVHAEYDSEPMVIGFNAAYLTEVLSHISADEIVFELSSPNRAGIVTPLEQREGEELLMLIMPVMLNTYA
jgi:DNA polymerase-3 subunit beta